jgi:hypothetical protein
MQNLSWGGGSQELTKPTTTTQLKMKDVCSLCNVIECFCWRKIIKIERGGPSSPFKLQMTLAHITTKCVLLWVSLNFEWIWTFLPNEIVLTPKWTETSCYGQWIVSLVVNETRLYSNEIKIYQTIQLLVN